MTTRFQFRPLHLLVMRLIWLLSMWMSFEQPRTNHAT